MSKTIIKINSDSGSVSVGANPLVTDNVQSDNITDKAGTGLPQLNGVTPEVKWQKKALTSNLNGTAALNTTITALGFSGLTVGKTYKLTVSPLYVETATATGANFKLNANHDGSPIIKFNFFMGSSDNENWSKGRSVIFEATATTVTIVGSGAVANSRLVGAADGADTYTLLEELPYHTETTDFT